MKKLTLAFVLSFSFCLSSFAETWTVSPTGKSDFSTIQEAVDASSHGDEILVMPGTYTSSGDAVVDMLGKELWLHSSEGPEVTIIDGESARGGILCENDETLNTRIEGFTFTRGNAYHGGGIFLFEASATITQCLFLDNTQSSMGAGVCCFSGDLQLSNSSFVGNQSWWAGGAVYAGGGLAIIEGCTFSQNRSSRGSAFYSSYGETYVSDSLFHENAGSGDYELGGGVYLEWSEGEIDACSFNHNIAKYGGAIYNDNSTMVFDQLEIHDNQATVLGGGIETFGSFPLISNSSICGNESDQIHGGWVDSGGNAIENECPIACPSDLNGDGTVSVTDLLELISEWGQTKSPADINSDGIVDVSDLLELVSNWGECD